MRVLFILLVGYFGAALGSFGTVVYHRLIRRKRGISALWKPIYSYCPWCLGRLKWYDNIPIFSYILLKGRCRNCYAKIPVIYFWLEVGFFILFCGIGYIFLINFH